MKKLLLLVSVALGYSALSYGMDDAAYDLFTRELADDTRSWDSVIVFLKDTDAEKLPLFVQHLLDSTIDLNAKRFGYLIDRFLSWYAWDGTTEQGRKNLRETLKMLIKHNKLDPDIKDPIFSKDADEKVGLEMLQQVRDEIAQEPARKVFKKRCMMVGVVGACIMAVYAVYRWYANKVDKDEQSKNATDGTDGSTESINQEMITV